MAETQMIRMRNESVSAEFSMTVERPGKWIKVNASRTTDIKPGETEEQAFDRAFEACYKQVYERMRAFDGASGEEEFSLL